MAGWEPRASLRDIFRPLGHPHTLSHHYLISGGASSWLLDLSPLLSGPVLSILTLVQHTDLAEVVIRKLCILSFPLGLVKPNAKPEENPRLFL